MGIMSPPMGIIFAGALAVATLAGCGGNAGEHDAEPAAKGPATPPAAATAPPAGPTAAPDAAPVNGAIAPVEPVHAGRAVSNDGRYVVTYRAVPDPIPLNEPFGLEIVVRDARDEATPVALAAIEVDGQMPHHGHGMNQVPTIRAGADGRFDVEGMLFHMPGYWELYFDITEGVVTERAQFSVELE